MGDFVIRPQAGVRGACAAARRQCRARGAAPERGRRCRRPRLEGGRARVGRGRGARARLRSSREGATAKGGARGSAGADGEGHDARDGLRHHRVVGDHGRARADHLAGRHARAPGRHGGRQQPRRRASPPARACTGSRSLHRGSGHQLRERPCGDAHAVRAHARTLGSGSWCARTDGQAPSRLHPRPRARDLAPRSPARAAPRTALSARVCWSRGLEQSKPALRWRHRSLAAGRLLPGPPRMCARC